MPRLFRYSQLAILTVGASALTLLCLLTTGVAALMKEDPGRAAALAPADPRVELDLANSLLKQQQGLPTSKSLNLALAAAPAAPLAMEPVLLAGAASANQGDAKRAEALLTEAKHRDPRSPLIRAYLLELYANSGRFAEAAMEIAALIRLVPDGAGELFIPQLAYLAQHSGAPAFLAPALKPNPGVRQALLLHLVQSEADAGLIVEIALKTKTGGKAEEGESWQMPLVERLVQAGQVEQAYRLWLRFAGVRPESPQALLHDGSFQNPAGQGPFGWKLAEGGAGAAEPNSKQGLDVSYYGRETVDLARQLLVLAPGQYRLTAEISGHDSPGRSALAWRIRCLEPGSEIMNLPLGNISFSQKRLSADFAVPPGCRGQWLSLGAQPPEFSKTEAVRIRAMGIRRLP